MSTSNRNSAYAQAYFDRIRQLDQLGELQSKTINHVRPAIQGERPRTALVSALQRRELIDSLASRRVAR